MIYNRQSSLNLKIPESVAVIGVGGVGNWVAMNLSLVGVKKIILIDNDKIEASNLNRSLFKLEHINQFKVNALAELIFERRDDCEVIPISKKFEDLTEDELTEVLNCQEVLNCADNIKLNKQIRKKIKVEGGYDGLDVTLHFNKKTEAWGDEEVRYTVTPSFLVAPQFIANIITLYLCSEARFKEEKIINLKDGDLINMLKEKSII